jgi:CcmD family protein
MRVLVFLLLFAFSIAVIPACAGGSGGSGAGDSAGSVTSAGLGGAEQQQDQPPKQTDEFVPISQLPAQDQLPAAPLLVTAYAFVWVVLFSYVVSVSRRLTKVQHEVERLESDISKRT